jgi:hypothetical protein
MTTRIHPVPLPAIRPGRAAAPALAGATRALPIDVLERDLGKALALAGPAAGVVSPAVMRSLELAATELLGGKPPAAVLLDAAKSFAHSPEAMEAFRKALPLLAALARKAGPSAGKLAGELLPMLAKGETVKAVLDAAAAVAGPAGRRLAGAALRGLAKGGLDTGAAELAATAAKMLAKSGATSGIPLLVAKGATKALPVIGNAANVLSVGTAVYGLVKSLRDPGASTPLKLAHVLQVVCSVAGCFVPPAGVVGDLVVTGAELVAR